ncbi:type VII secretion protein EccB [Streptomyces canus]|uniref:type VII secretion protein EccB n=1 Tax=Streptomyces canus TaxID=58343 RepID=UPI002789814A|nr:type VII secretion protein EccB [Streptomyces canus]MDQ0765436.1 type VII secretion protein EccB [Streptomyces canus]
MQSKRDQVQAHAFVMGRLTSGMLLADPDAPESPLARTTRGAVIGVVVAVIISAGAAVYGLISPGGNTSWRTSDTLIVNRDTGGRYLYIDGRLRPVRNYASALLIGGKKLTTTAVRTASLRGTPVGAPVGIPGAPDSVPAAKDLDGGAWRVCSSLGSAGTAVTTLVAGAPVDGRAVAEDQALVVTGPDKATYLVWRGSRLRLDKASGAAVSLGYDSVTPRPVSAAFLNALAPGAALAPPSMPGRGTAGPSLGGARGTVGRVYVVRVLGSAPKYYLLRKDGLVPLTAVGAALVLGDPSTREKAYGGHSPEAEQLSADVLGEHLASGDQSRSVSLGGLPDSPPRAASVPDDQAACARVESVNGLVRISTVLVPRGALAPVTQVEPGESAAACLPVDAVVVRPGRGALVRALGAGGTTLGDTTYFVAEDGVKYRVSSSDALKALGYADSDVVALPSPLLSMLPSGPDLDPGVAAGGGSATITPPACGNTSGGSGRSPSPAGRAPGT